MRKIVPDLIRKKPLLFILFIAVLIRTAYFIIYYSSPTWGQLLVDSLFHDRWAMEIAKGKILGEEPFFRAPFYIYLLGGIYAIFGHSLIAARISGHLIGLVSICLTYFIATRLFSKKVAVIAGLIHALYPIAIYFESELLVEALFTMLVELSIYLLFLSTDYRRRSLYLLGGISLGLAAITRAVILPLIPIYLIWIIFIIRQRKPAILAMVLWLIGALIPVLPVTARNLFVGHDFVTIASSGGINFYIGNNQSADGLSAAVPTLGSNWQIQDITFMAEQDAGRKMKASELSDYWYKKGWDWILNDKIEFLKLYFKKLYFCVNNFEVSNNRDIALFFLTNQILKYDPLNFALIFALAIIGIIILTVRKICRDKITFLLIWAAAYLFLISLFFINSRFRLPIVPITIIAASFGITGLISLWKSRLYILKIGTLVLSGAATFAFSESNFYLVQKDNLRNGLYNEANYFLAQGNYPKALELYHKVLVADPSYPKANLNLGAAFLRMGQLDSARYYFTQETALYPESAPGYSNLASISYLRRNYEKALEYANESISLMPYLPEGYLVKMRALAAMNDTAGIESTINDAEKIIGKHPRISLDAGLIFSNLKMYDKAKSYLYDAFNSRPKPIETNDEAFGRGDYIGEIVAIRARAAYQLGYIFGINNDLPKAIEMSNAAIALDSSLVEAYVNLINGYRLSGNEMMAGSILNLALKKFPDSKILKAFK